MSAVTCDRDQKIRLDTSLSVWVIEAKGVPLRKKYFCELLLDKVLFGRTSVKLKNDMLFWGEKFVFDDLPPTESLTISLFRESDTTKKKRNKEKHAFVGSSVVDLLSMETNVENEKWVSVFVPAVSPKLQQKTLVNNNSGGGKDKSSATDQQPFIRARFKYETTIVLPLVSYKALHKYVRDNYLLLVSTLESGISLKIKDLLAQTMLKILQANNSAELFLVDIIMNEVCNTADENLTFRGNSLATKSIDTYMKMIGKSYLQDTLGAFVNSVYENEEDTEVDPQKIASPGSNNNSNNSTTTATLSNNQQFLKKLLQSVWKCITDSTLIFPVRLRRVFSMVRERCEAKGLGCISKKITSASLFLRFLCPAILSPSLFQLSREYPVERVARTLTLIAKTVQNLANFTRFGSKESYMGFLNEFVENEMPNMDKFLLSVSVLDDDIHDPCLKADENIDLSRALSILYHILQSEIPGLSKDDRDKLTKLMPILRQIAEIHEVSPKVDELRLSRPFATVASVCSKPLTTPLARDDTTPSAASSSSGVSSMGVGSTPVTPLLSPRNVVETVEERNDIPTTGTDCYRDTAHSFNEDYVSPAPGSGPAFLPMHRNSPSRNLAKLNEGRGTIDRKKLHLSSRSTPDINGVGGGRRSKSVDTNKYDKLAASQAKHHVNNKSEPSLNSLKRRQFEQHQQQQQQQYQHQQGLTSPGTPKSPIRKGGKDLSSNSVKDRISMFSSPKSSAASCATSPSTPTLVSPKSGLANKTFMSNSNRHHSIPGGKTTSQYHSLSKPSKPSSPHVNNKTNTLPSSKSSSSSSSSIPVPARSSSGTNHTAATATPPGLRKPPHQTNTPPQPSRSMVSSSALANSSKEKEKPAPATSKKPLTKSQSLVLSPKPSLRPKPGTFSGSQLSLQRPNNNKSNSPFFDVHKKNTKDDRPKLTLSNLRKEHNFDDGSTSALASGGCAISPELLAYERSPKRSYSDRGANVFGDAIITASNTKPTTSATTDASVNGSHCDDTNTNNSSRHNTISKYSLSSRTEHESDYDDAYKEEEGTLSWGSQLRIPMKDVSGVGGGGCTDDLDTSSDTVVVTPSSKSSKPTHHREQHQQHRYPPTSATLSSKNTSDNSRKSGAVVQRRHSELSPRELEKKRNNNGQHQQNNGNANSLVAQSQVDIVHARHHSANLTTRNCNGIRREDSFSGGQHHHQQQQHDPHRDNDRSLVVETFTHASNGEVLREGYVFEQNHNNNHRQQEQQQQRHRNNSVSSLEYSSCEYSSDSYYTSEDDLDFGEIIEGDTMDDVLKEHQRTATNGVRNSRSVLYT